MRHPLEHRDASGSKGGSAMTSGSPSARRLLIVNFTACGLLLVQYLLGMVANLFVTLPDSHPGAGAGNYFGGAASGIAWLIPDGPAWAAAHAALGLALVLAAVASITLTWRQPSRLATALSVLAALAIIGAAFNGVSFLNYGHDFSSMIMAGLWALAMASYLSAMLTAALAVLPRPHTPR